MPSAAPGPADRELAELRATAAACRACELWERATQTVFGEGPARARLMLVGEQPGDREDIEGHVFVGPAGRVLDRALAQAEIARDDVYLTNAVKHFRWKRGERGKKRLHDTPSWSHVGACLPWLEAELDAVQPRVIVPMGAIAVGALLGRKARVTRLRGQVLSHADDRCLVVTVHPSSVLRAPDDEARRRAFEAFAADLGVARAAAGSRDAR